MKFLFIHGSPATGKLTVAKELLGVVPGRLFDNHVAIDTALTVFDFGAPGFWELVHDVRCTVVEASAKQGIQMLITTFCYNEGDRQQFEDFDAIVRKFGGATLPVCLQCDKEEVLRRLGNRDRIQRGKISTEKGLDRFNSKFIPASVPRQNCLTLDSGVLSAGEVAKTIASHFRLCTPEITSDS